MKIKRSKLWVGIIITLLFGGYLYYQNDQSKVNSSSAKNALYMVDGDYVYATPTTTIKEPSQKGLKIASFFIARASQNEINNLKKSHGNTEMSDSQLIRKIAIVLDSDSAKMAKFNALMDKVLAEENKPVYYYSEGDSYSYETASSDNDEYRKIQNQLDEQERHLRNMESAARTKCIMNGGVYSPAAGCM